MKTSSKTADRAIDRFDIYCRRRNLSDAMVTRDCGLAVGTIGKSRKEGKDLSRRVVAIILEEYDDLNPEWLQYGVGEMFAERPKEVLPGFPLIDATKAECGRPGGLSEAVMSDTARKIVLPGIPNDTEFFIQASGYSMINDERPELSIPPGALVGISKLNRTTFMRWGEVYLVSTADGLMIKRLLQDDDPEFVRCASYNVSDYPEFRMRKDEIIDCGRITCVVPIYLR